MSSKTSTQFSIFNVFQVILEMLVSGIWYPVSGIRYRVPSFHSTHPTIQLNLVSFQFRYDISYNFFFPKCECSLLFQNFGNLPYNSLNLKEHFTSFHTLTVDSITLLFICHWFNEAHQYFLDVKPAGSNENSK